MHSLEEIRAEYDRLDRLCGVDTSAVEIALSRRGVRRLGSFRYPAKGKAGALRITINASLLDEEEAFWDTVRHEYAHALVYLRHPGERHGVREVAARLQRAHAGQIALGIEHLEAHAPAHTDLAIPRLRIAQVGLRLHAQHGHGVAHAARQRRLALDGHLFLAAVHQSFKAQRLSRHLQFHAPSLPLSILLPSSVCVQTGKKTICAARQS